MGFKTIAIIRGKDKKEIVRKIGAREYIASKSKNPVKELVKLGAKIILGTVPSGKAMSEVLDGLVINGKIIIITSVELLEVSPNFFSPDVYRSWAGPVDLLSIRKTFSFNLLSGVWSINEVFPRGRASKAYDLMMSALLYLSSFNTYIKRSRIEFSTDEFSELEERVKQFKPVASMNKYSNSDLLCHVSTCILQKKSFNRRHNSSLYLICYE